MLELTDDLDGGVVVAINGNDVLYEVWKVGQPPPAVQYWSNEVRPTAGVAKRKNWSLHQPKNLSVGELTILKMIARQD